MRPRAQVPSGHGELVLQPPCFDDWVKLAEANAAAAATWRFDIGGMDIRDFRRSARELLVADAREATSRLGLSASGTSEGPVIVTGHQPDLYHAGVWIKNFALQRVVNQCRGLGIDLVVDTDTYESVGVTAPCLSPRVTRCKQELAVGGEDSCFVCTAVPSAQRLEGFCAATASALATLPSPAIGRHFDAFCDALRASACKSANLAEFITGARRRYEGDLTHYLELPVSDLACTVVFRRFAADILLGASRFAEAYNAELAEYRTLNGIRSGAQPFPDLQVAPEEIESPFWVLTSDGRVPAFVRQATNGVRLVWSQGAVFLPESIGAAASVLEEAGVALVPRAVTLTLFARACVADLFIHGIGGDRYDRITEGVARRWWGITLPAYAVASLTMYLPLGATAVSDSDLAAIDAQLRRLTHNPDEALGEVTFDSAEERRAVLARVEEKRELIEAISVPGADRKALGLRIKALNDELSVLVEPLAEELRAHRAALESQQRDAEVLTDRTYPFCLWSPAEVADKVL